MSRKEGRTGLASFEDSVDTPIGRLKDNIKKTKERLITTIRNNTYNSRINRTITRKQNEKKSNCMDISSDKAESHAQKLGYGYEGETLKEKLNFFL